MSSTAFSNENTNGIISTRSLLSTIILLSLLSCGGCAQTKSVQPVRMSQEGDQDLSCSELTAQIEANQQAAVNFANQARESQANYEQTVVGTALVAGFAGAVLSGALIDLSKEDQIEFRSLEDRNRYLVFLKGRKGC